MRENISIIILNYNGKQYLEGCLRSVLAQTYSEFELLLYDNASTDGSIDFVNKNFSDGRLKIISSQNNIGFAGGNNEAIRHASNDLIVLLNNDTTVQPDWLEKLAEAVKEKNTVASSFVITQGIPQKYYETNGSLSYLMYNIMNVFPDINDEFYPNGASCIFRLSETGIPFDPDYFFYGEDVYLGLKARFLGLKIKFVNDSVVHHIGEGSKSSNSFKTFCRERNRFLNLYLFFSPFFIFKMLPFITFNHNIKVLLSLFSRKSSFTGTLKAYFWFYFNIPLILRKRKELKEIKKVNEKEIIKYLSSRVFHGENFYERVLNKFSYIYSRLVGIKPIEYYQKKS